MRLSTRARYGLRMCFLLALTESECVPLSTLVKQTDLSEKYLEQILTYLKKGSIVNSIRGANGGYFLINKPEQITINQILIALDDSFDLTDCALGQCDDSYCPNKKMFQKIHLGINSMLDSLTLKDMIDDYRCV